MSTNRTKVSDEGNQIGREDVNDDDDDYVANDDFGFGNDRFDDIDDFRDDKGDLDNNDNAVHYDDDAGDDEDGNNDYDKDDGAVKKEIHSFDYDFENEECNENISLDEEQITSLLEREEKKIRDFLKEDRDVDLEYSFFEKPEKESTSETNSANDFQNPYDEFMRNKNNLGSDNFRQDLNSIKCRAFVIEPYCQLSETIINLPATPYTSFSLYRFYLNGLNVSNSICLCGRSKKNCEGKPNFEAFFEFKYSSPQIKLEPQSGYLREGDRLPITIIFKPEFEIEHLIHEAQILKAKELITDKHDRIQVPSVTKAESLAKTKSKGHSSSHKKLGSTNITDDRVEKVIDLSLIKLNSGDLYAGEKGLLEFVSPSFIEIPVNCLIKVIDCEIGEAMENHKMLLICPMIKPAFKYLGLNQEIKMGKTPINTTSRYILEVQNISLDRITPEISLLNPVGPFSCPGAMRKVEVDPEHIWRQVLTYRPMNPNGVERAFFEIKCGSTILFLTVTGETDTESEEYYKKEFDTIRSFLSMDYARKKSEVFERVLSGIRDKHPNKNDEKGVGNSKVDLANSSLNNMLQLSEDKIKSDEIVVPKFAPERISHDIIPRERIYVKKFSHDKVSADKLPPEKESPEKVSGDNIYPEKSLQEQMQPDKSSKGTQHQSHDKIKKGKHKVKEEHSVVPIKVERLKSLHFASTTELIRAKPSKEEVRFEDESPTGDPGEPQGVVKKSALKKSSDMQSALKKSSDMQSSFKKSSDVQQNISKK